MPIMNSHAHNFAQEKYSLKARSDFRILITFLITLGIFFGGMQNLASAKGGVMHIADSPEAVKPLTEGAKAPNSPLTKIDGTATTLADVLNKEAAVLIFYRGSWWGQCPPQLAELNKITKELKDLGYNLFAISPDTPVGLKELTDERKLNFPLFSDSSSATIVAFGLAYKLNNERVSTYLNKYKVDIEKASGQKHHNLPIPGVYIIGADGVIDFAYSNPDHRIRLTNAEVMEAVKAIKK